MKLAKRRSAALRLPDGPPSAWVPSTGEDGEIIERGGEVLDADGDGVGVGGAASGLIAGGDPRADATAGASADVDGRPVAMPPGGDARDAPRGGAARERDRTPGVAAEPGPPRRRSAGRRRVAERVDTEVGDEEGAQIESWSEREDDREVEGVSIDTDEGVGVGGESSPAGGRDAVAHRYERRPVPVSTTVQLGAAAVVVVSVFVGRGDLAAVGAAVALSGGGVAVGVTGFAVVAALALRWGTTDVARVAGSVGVLGAGVTVGPGTAVAACAVAGFAVSLAMTSLRAGWAARAALAALGAMAIVGPVPLALGHVRGLIGTVAATVPFGVVAVVADRTRGPMRRRLSAAAPLVAGLAVALGALR